MSPKFCEIARLNEFDERESLAASMATQLDGWECLCDC